MRWLHLQLEYIVTLLNIKKNCLMIIFPYIFPFLRLSLTSLQLTIRKQGRFYCSLTLLQHLQMKPLVSSYEIFSGHLACMLTFHNLQTLEVISLWNEFLIS